MTKHNTPIPIATQSVVDGAAAWAAPLAWDHGPEHPNHKIAVIVMSLIGLIYQLLEETNVNPSET